jgi:hypothetical protein
MIYTKIQNKDALLQGLVKNLGTEKGRLVQEHRTIIHTLKAASMKTKELLEYERNKYKFSISLLISQIDEYKRHVDEVDRSENDSSMILL